MYAHILEVQTPQQIFSSMNEGHKLRLRAATPGVVEHLAQTQYVAETQGDASILAATRELCMAEFKDIGSDKGWYRATWKC